jgi:hypothetical protein
MPFSLTYLPMCFKKSEFNPEHQQNIISLINEGTEILKMIVASINTVRLKISQQKK